MQIVSKGKNEIVVTHGLFFRRVGGSRHDGFCFPCDEYGRPKDSEMTPTARESLLNCLARREPVEDPVVEQFETRIKEYAIGICEDCGDKVELSGFTNTCECGADYNMSGQRLAPREQWGEETNETADEILMVDGMSTERCLDGDDW